MTKSCSAGSAVILLLALVSSSCGSVPERVLTVEEFVPRIDELNGQTVSVTGYLAGCGGYDCQLYRTKADADMWDRFVTAARAGNLGAVPEGPTVGIGTGANFEFDAQAAPFKNSYVIITGTVTNRCRFDGKPECTDRSTDLKPTAIRAEPRPVR